MRSGFIVAIIGIILAVVAAGVFAYSLTQATQMQETVNVPVNGTKEYTIPCQEGSMYTIALQSNGTFTYELLAPGGTVVEESTNATTSATVVFNATETGDYTLRIYNADTTDIEVQIMVMSNSDIMSLVMGMAGALVLCCVGIILVIIGLIIGILQGKKQRQPVYQPPPPPPPSQPEGGEGYQEV